MLSQDILTLLQINYFIKIPYAKHDLLFNFLTFYFIIKMKKSVRNPLEPIHFNIHSNNTNEKSKKVTNQTAETTSNTCQQHPNKTATHRLIRQQSSQSLYYCQKCSIMLASQGFNVRKLAVQRNPSRQSPAPTKSRLKQIEGFLFSLDQYLKVLSAKYTQIQDHLVESEDHYNSLTDKITQYFSSLQEILEMQKYISYNSLLTRRSTSEAEFRQLRDQLRCAIVEIQGMMDDIQNNLDAVECVEYSVYSSIIKGYQQKIAHIPQLINIQLQSLEKYEISIPQIPSFVYSLADKITLVFMAPTSCKPSVIQYQNIQNAHNEGNQYEVCCDRSHISENKVKYQTTSEYLRKDGQIKQLGFSFDSKDHENALCPDVNSNDSHENNNYILPRDLQQQSLGVFFQDTEVRNYSEQNQATEEQQTQTLLIV